MTTATDTTAEERQLWADYYEAVARALEIMKAEGTGEVVLQRVAAQQVMADRALARINEIRRRGESARVDERNKVKA